MENTQDYAPKQYPDNTTTRSVRKRKPISNPTPIPKPDKWPNGLSTTPSSDNAIPGTKSVKKLISPHLQFGKEVDTRHFTTSEPPNSYDHEEITVRCEQPSLDWQRRWQFHRLHKYNRQNTTKKDYPQWYFNNPNDYDTPKRPLPENTTPETYIHDPDFNFDPYHNPQLYNRESLTFRQRECTPFEEYIKKTGMNISTEPQHRPKTIQPVPDYDQDAERVTEILVDDTTNRPKSILKNQGPQITTPQSPPKDQPVHPIRAGILQSPTMDVAPDSHQLKNVTCRTTTEVVDLAQSTTNTEITLSKPKTRRIKRSLLLEPLPCGETSFSPSPLNSQSEDEVEGRCYKQHTSTGQSKVLPLGTDCRIPEDKPYEWGNTYPLSQKDRQSEEEVEDPRPTETAATNMQSGSPTGAVNNSPTQDEPQSYPTAQIAESLTKDSVTNEQCIPIFSAVTLKKKKKMLFAPMDFQDLTLDALIDSGALVNCVSETDYNKISQMSPKDIVKELDPPPSNSKSQTETLKPLQRQSSSNSRSVIGTLKKPSSSQNDSQAQYSASLFSRAIAPSWT